ncbi:MAG: ROK family protein [Thiohalobacterales bacterium]|nr:ROK family protein [Thiohalobacterales bacterium]
MNILVVDIGGISVKLCTTGQTPRAFPTPRGMTPQQLMQGIRDTVGDWTYDRVSIGFPGPVRRDKPQREPVNLGTGWVDFDFAAAFGAPVRMLNDAAMQALGSYRDGVMLFLGLGTGLGTTLIHDGHVVPMEISHLPFRDGMTFETCLGQSGLDTAGEARWKEHVLEAIGLFTYTLCPEHIVLGGGNSRRFTAGELPGHVSLGDNINACTGGLRMWEEPVPATGQPAS